MKAIAMILWFIGGFLGVSVIIYIATCFIFWDIYKKTIKEMENYEEE
jgi:hypothetical protein